MRESCGIGHSYINLRHWDFRAFSPFTCFSCSVRGRARNSIFSRLWRLVAASLMSAFGGGEWRGDRSGSSADGIVLARKRNVGNMESSDRWPTVPVFCLTNVGGVRISVYKNFRIMQIWTLKRKYDLGLKMRKFHSRMCRCRSCRRRGRRKRRRRSKRR